MFFLLLFAKDFKIESHISSKKAGFQENVIAGFQERMKAGKQD